MTKAHIYTRYSPKPDQDETDALARQEAPCREYAAKQGWEVASLFQDAAISGNEENRPGLWAAVASVKRGDILLVAAPDRLARDVFLAETIRRMVAKTGGRVVAVSNPLDDDKPADKMVRQILDSFAEYERNMISMRTRMAMRYKQRQGFLMSRHAPFGYRAEDGKLVKEDREQGIIRMIGDAHASGMTLRGICADLDGKKIQPRSGHWHPEKVRSILKRIHRGAI